MESWIVQSPLALILQKDWFCAKELKTLNNGASF